MLSRPASARPHKLSDRLFRELEAELQQLFMTPGAPQVGCSLLIRRMRSISARLMVGRPAGHADFRRHQARHKRRCQRATSAGARRDSIFATTIPAMKHRQGFRAGEIIPVAPAREPEHDAGRNGQCRQAGDRDAQRFDAEQWL
jgi:hypothetical protein